jgi:hypothetical protein
MVPHKYRVSHFECILHFERDSVTVRLLVARVLNKVKRIHLDKQNAYTYLYRIIQVVNLKSLDTETAH